MERKKEILISGSQLAVILCICRLPDILFGLPASGETQIRAVILGEGVRLLTFLPLCANIKLNYYPCGGHLYGAFL